MKKYLVLIVYALLCAAVISGCSGSAGPSGINQPEIDQSDEEQPSEGLTAASLLDSVNLGHRRFTETQPVHPVTDYFVAEVSPDRELTDGEINDLLRGGRIKQNITAGEALDDLDVLMRLLETSYAGYEYFGGSERFDKARDSITERVLEAYGGQDGEGSVILFLDILRDELSFIEDSHLRFDKQTDFKERVLYYEDSRMVFDAGPDGYSTLINGEKWYLADIDEQYIMPTCDGGSLCCGLFGLAADDAELPTEFFLHSGDKVIELAANWRPAKAGDGRSKAHDLYEQDGVKVLRIGAFSDSSSNRLAEYARELRGEDVFIIDLRGNQGGIVMITDIFLHELTGSVGRFPLQAAKRFSTLNKRLLADSAELIRNNGSDALKESLGSGGYIEEFSEFGLSPEEIDSITVGSLRTGFYDGRWNGYDGCIIALCDKETCSAAEMMLLKLMTFENVIILGTNSNGCLLTADVNVQSIALPRTSIPLSFGQSIAVTSLSDGFDSRGILPDVACRADAMADAVALADMLRENDSAKGE